MRLLLIEDDPGVAAYIQKGLNESGHTVDPASDGKSGLALATSEDYDAMIIDRMLPGIDGIKIVKSIRAAGIDTPILILSALGEVDDRVVGLKAGADDYLPNHLPSVNSMPGWKRCNGARQPASARTPASKSATSSSTNCPVRLHAQVKPSSYSRGSTACSNT